MKTTLGTRTRSTPKVAKILQPGTRADMWLQVDGRMGISTQVKTCRGGDGFKNVVGYGDRPVLCVSYTPEYEGGFCENVTQIDAVYILLYEGEGRKGRVTTTIPQIRGDTLQKKCLLLDSEFPPEGDPVDGSAVDLAFNFLLNKYKEKKFRFETELEARNTFAAHSNLKSEAALITRWAVERGLWKELIWPYQDGKSDVISKIPGISTGELKIQVKTTVRAKTSPDRATRKRRKNSTVPQKFEIHVSTQEKLKRKRKRKQVSYKQGDFNYLLAGVFIPEDRGKPGPRDLCKTGLLHYWLIPMEELVNNNLIGVEKGFWLRLQFPRSPEEWKKENGSWTRKYYKGTLPPAGAGEVEAEAADGLLELREGTSTSEVRPSEAAAPRRSKRRKN